LLPLRHTIEGSLGSVDARIGVLVVEHEALNDTLEVKLSRS
jgi:hypothetical protein